MEQWILTESSSYFLHSPVYNKCGIKKLLSDFFAIQVNNPLEITQLIDYCKIVKPIRNVPIPTVSFLMISCIINIHFSITPIHFSSACFTFKNCPNASYKHSSDQIKQSAKSVNHNECKSIANCAWRVILLYVGRLVDLNVFFKISATSTYCCLSYNSSSLLNESILKLV